MDDYSTLAQPTELYDVEIELNGQIIAVIQARAKDAESAEIKAVDQVKVKTRKAHI